MVGENFSLECGQNKRLRRERGVPFAEIVIAIGEGGLLDVLEHRNPSRCPRLRLLVVALRQYAYLVPYIEKADGYFLKTIIPSRKATCDYLRRSRH